MNKEQIYNFLSTQSNIFEILRENDFKMAKEFFGTRKIGYDFEKGRDIQVWDSNLVRMILEKDPLAYMKNFIKEKV